MADDRGRRTRGPAKSAVLRIRVTNEVHRRFTETYWTRKSAMNYHDVEDFVRALLDSYEREQLPR